MVDGKDIHVSSVNSLTAPPPAKPTYLMKFLPEGKAKAALFIAIELPKFDVAYVQAKGFFYDGDEADIVTNYMAIIAETDKNSLTEMWFPWHSIKSVKSLIFKVNKNK